MPSAGAGFSSGVASVLLASEDSEEGLKMRVCGHGQDRTHPVGPWGSGKAGETGEGSQHAQKVVWRARTVLLAGDGVGAVAVARQVGKSLTSVRRWRRRYASAGVEGLLKDATRPPGRQPLAAETMKRVVDLTLHETPGATHWSERRWRRRWGLRRRRCTRSGRRTG